LLSLAVLLLYRSKYRHRPPLSRPSVLSNPPPYILLETRLSFIVVPTAVSNVDPLVFLLCTIMCSNFQQAVLCSGRRGEGGDEDGDGKGRDSIKALLRIASDFFLGVRGDRCIDHRCIDEWQRT